MVAQKLLRRQVVQAGRGGMTQAAVARTSGASLRAVSNWVELDRTGGPGDLRLKCRGGGGLLNEKQAVRIRGLMDGELY